MLTSLTLEKLLKNWKYPIFPWFYDENGNPNFSFPIKGAKNQNTQVFN